jgi:hypothetical protein
MSNGTLITYGYIALIISMIITLGHVIAASMTFLALTVLVFWWLT